MDTALAMPLSSTSIAIIVLAPIASLLVLARIYVKIFNLRTYGHDDTAIIVAWVCYLAFAISLSIELREAMDPESLKKQVILMNIANVLYSLTSLVLRIAIGLFFLRLITNPMVRRLVWAVMIVSTINNLYDINFIIFFCGSPVNYVEKFLARKCLSKTVALANVYEQAAVNALADIFFTVLPMHILWGSMMTRTKLFSIGFIMTLGTLGSIFCIIRIPAIASISQSTKPQTPEKLYLWSTLEISMGIIASCLPSLSSSIQSGLQYVVRWLTRSKIVWRDPNGLIRVRNYTRRRVSLTVETAPGETMKNTTTTFTTTTTEKTDTIV